MDPMILHLGKHPARHDPRTLKAARYMATLAPAPDTADWTKSVSSSGWPMMGNDRLGDCTCAAAGHLVQAWTGAANPPPLVLTDDVIIAAYRAQGYDPTNPSTDRGAVELDVLNYWRQQGLGGSGHKIAAFAALNVKDQDEIKQAIFLFGGIYVGLALPLSAQAQTRFMWDVVNDPVKGGIGSWGGHAVPILAYDAQGLTCITWGEVQRMSWAFFFAYCDEAYALVTADFLEKDGQSPSGFDIETLQADLLSIGQQVETPFPPPNVPEVGSLATWPTSPRLVALTSAEVRAAGSARQLWRLIDDFVCVSPTLGTFTVPAGFVTDLGSTPPEIWSFISPEDPTALYGFIGHDQLYAWNGLLPYGRTYLRDQADRYLAFEAMPALGATRLKQDAVYAGLRVGGGSHWGTNAKSRPPS